MPSAIDRLAGLTLVLCALTSVGAQGASQNNSQAPHDTENLGEVPRVPGVSTFWRGLNAGVTFSGVHDSSIGWYTVATPAASYTFSPHYSADVSLSMYPSRLVQSQNPGSARGQRLVLDVGDLGDTFLGLHASFKPRGLRNTTTASLTFPSGDRAVGLGAGKVTFDFSDHVERYHKQAGFLLDFGAGNSSGLFNRLVTNDYTTVGALVHVQAGMIFWAPGSNYIQSVFYEQHPFGSQTVYSNPGPPGAPSLFVISGNNVGEDNGVTTSVGIPLTDHIILSGYYSRSFEQPLDTVSVGVTYVLRGIPRFRRMSMIDRALREAESGDEEQTTQQSPGKQKR